MRLFVSPGVILVGQPSDKLTALVLVCVSTLPHPCTLGVGLGGQPSDTLTAQVSVCVSTLPHPSTLGVGLGGQTD